PFIYLASGREHSRALAFYRYEGGIGISSEWRLAKSLYEGYLTTASLSLRLGHERDTRGQGSTRGILSFGLRYWAMRYYQILLLLLFLMPTAARSDCVFPWPQGTFLQVYDSHLTKDSDGWRHDISRWKSLGVEELVLQWSAYGSPEGEAFPIIESGTLRRLLDAAEAAAVKLRTGLR